MLSREQDRPLSAIRSLSTYPNALKGAGDRTDKFITVLKSLTICPNALKGAGDRTDKFITVFRSFSICLNALKTERYTTDFSLSQSSVVTITPGLRTLITCVYSTSSTLCLPGTFCRTPKASRCSA
ncbi:hypothetical protein E2C01_015421 [Portunus trituberculatus]|uniref:Uncharacterized protein n=1 Tax=Portunus trituberculatus TaxID=210409 RepID=A0A5B7DMQ4_PORTR|nr:hypothetical protein [Portunus trituberculatus]